MPEKEKKRQKRQKIQSANVDVNINLNVGENVVSAAGAAEPGDVEPRGVAPVQPITGDAEKQAARLALQDRKLELTVDRLERQAKTAEMSDKFSGRLAMGLFKTETLNQALTKPTEILSSPGATARAAITSGPLAAGKLAAGLVFGKGLARVGAAQAAGAAGVLYAGAKFASQLAPAVSHAITEMLELPSQVNTVSAGISNILNTVTGLAAGVGEAFDRSQAYALLGANPNVRNIARTEFLIDRARSNLRDAIGAYTNYRMMEAVRRGLTGG